MELEKIKTEICIVGAGPAGATISIALSNLGIAHTIVDASDFPRDKICGDALDLNVVRVLNMILPGFVCKELKNEKIFSLAPGLLFRLPNGKSFEMTERNNDGGPRSFFYVSKRFDFDNLLVSQLNPDFATWKSATRIEKVERKSKGWILYATTKSGKIEIECNMLVGADGAHSIVLKQVGDVKIDRRNYAAAVRQYWSGIEGLHPDRMIEVYFPRSMPLSYFWIFPLPDGLCNVGYGMSSSFIASKNINVRKSFEDLIKQDPYLATRFKNAKPIETIKGWGLPMSGSNRKAFGDGWLLAGDAASMICPTTGEGIGSGMISGYIAAHFLQHAHSKQCYDEKMFLNYNREIHKRLWTDELLFKLVTRMPAWAFTWVINTVLSNKYLQDVVVKKHVGKWLETAFTKPITVDLD